MTWGQTLPSHYHHHDPGHHLHHAQRLIDEERFPE
jgi:hypothetical protein